MVARRKRSYVCLSITQLARGVIIVVHRIIIVYVASLSLTAIVHILLGPIICSVSVAVLVPIWVRSRFLLLGSQRRCDL